jgi:hypothetical protein
VRDRFVTEQLVSVLDQVAGGIEHDQHFGEQGLDVRLAGFAGHELCDFGFSLVQKMLEFLQDRDSQAYGE